MKISLDAETKDYLYHKNCNTLTVNATRDCDKDDCSEFYDYVVTCKGPDSQMEEGFERYDTEGVTVWFDKSLEKVPVVTLRMEHHILGDKIRVAGPGHPRE